MESTSGYFVTGTKNQITVLNADETIKVRSLKLRLKKNFLTFSL
jgi:hypothetical protein